ncbi:hypothetical protein ILUMI_10746 [Ignelater luminosus]|uniref:Uncharacterized protein n=1 Tax=Ignelater luminosus TaxID=2038154 RepID=A0A8K0D1K2_IGNLU|nr:hypothetical protein ILUMI_10746 [Ignelater luminosus]
MSLTSVVSVDKGVVKYLGEGQVPNRKKIETGEILGILFVCIDVLENFHGTVATGKRQKLKKKQNYSGAIVALLNLQRIVADGKIRKKRQIHAVVDMFRNKFEYKSIAQLGTIDGKHIAIKTSVNKGSDFKIVKGYQRWISDGGVLRGTRSNKLLEKSKRNLFSNSALSGSDQTTPYIFVGKVSPYNEYDETVFRNFGHRVQVTEFLTIVSGGPDGCQKMSLEFKVLRKHLLLQPETVTKVVSSICIIIPDKIL